jgi:cytochrome c peroxidase
MLKYWSKWRVLLLSLGFFQATPLAVAGDPAQYRGLYKRPAEIPHPESNSYSKERYELGRVLFFDPRLSRSNWISCASCHNPGMGWSDGLPVAIGDGMKKLERRTQPLQNLAWSEIFMWDGRASTLEEQALAPVVSQVEMNLTIEELDQKIKAIKGYRTLFEKAYPGEGITGQTISKALANFERQLVSAQAPFDRWVEGDDDAINASAKRGFVLFNEKALCSKCHSGWRFTDDSFHDIGVPGDDLGRGRILPMIPVLQNAFKTPGLRNLAQRAPYLHNGSEQTLADVITFYNQGGKAKRANQSEHIKPLGLNKAEMKDLLEFLNTLNSQDPEMSIPSLPQ